MESSKDWIEAHLQYSFEEAVRIFDDFFRLARSPRVLRAVLLKICQVVEQQGDEHELDPAWSRWFLWLSLDILRRYLARRSPRLWLTHEACRMFFAAACLAWQLFDENDVKQRAICAAYEPVYGPVSAPDLTQAKLELLDSVDWILLPLACCRAAAVATGSS